MTRRREGREERVGVAGERTDSVRDGRGLLVVLHCSDVLQRVWETVNLLPVVVLLA